MNPFTSQEEQHVGHLGERSLIESISDCLGETNPPPPAGIGDDAAILEGTVDRLVLTKDSLVYQKHFDDSPTPKQVGAKLLKRNISDIAAMGGQPKHAIVACLLPPNTSTVWLSAFYAGLRDTASRYSVDIVGGDITSTFKDLAFTLSLLGKASKKLITRKTAEPDDTLWVTGTLGGSILNKHLDFEPRLKEGQWLAAIQDITSGMDVSDGLATDLLNLCPEGCGFELDSDSIPVSEDARTLSHRTGKDPIQHALSDGEDYELLFTLSSQLNPDSFIQEWSKELDTQITCIGKVLTKNSPEQNIIKYTGSHSIDQQPGYEHFR